LDLLTINRKQIFNLFYAIIIVVVDLIVIIILISNFGYTGVAIAKFVAIIGGGIFLITVFKKSGGRSLSIDFRVLIWSLVIFGIQYLISGLPLSLYIAVTFLNIAINTFILRFFNNKEIDLIRSIIPTVKNN